MRFFVESFSNGISIARKALNNPFDVANNGSHVQTNMFVNWSDLAQPQFSWYRPNTDAGPTDRIDLPEGRQS
jgi:hypothetical protein